MEELRQKLEKFLGLDCRLAIGGWVEVYSHGGWVLMRIKIHEFKGEWKPCSLGLSNETVDFVLNLT